MKHRSRIRFFFMISLLVLSVVGCKKKPEIPTMQISMDYPATESLEEMAEAASCIIKGTYNGEYSIWNMARDPMDPSKEDPKLYYEGRLYTFHVEEVIKGDVAESEIQVNHSYAHNETYTESDAVVDELGIVQKEATWSKEHTLLIKDPLFTEPQKDTEYILFLIKSDDFDHYYGAIEPFMIRLDQGKAVLQTNLTREKNISEETITTEDGFTIRVIQDGGGGLKDTITGLTEEELEERIFSDMR